MSVYVLNQNFRFYKPSARSLEKKLSALCYMQNLQCCNKIYEQHYKPRSLHTYEGSRTSVHDLNLKRKLVKQQDSDLYVYYYTIVMLIFEKVSTRDDELINLNEVYEK